MSSDSHVASTTEPEDPRIARGVVIGAAIGVVLSFIGTTIGMLFAGVALDRAATFGLFVAFWGGLGFGTMMGGVLGFLQATEDPAEGHDHY